MIFRRFTRKRPVMTSLIAGGTLVVMAVVGWGVPLGDLAEAAGLSLLVVLLLALPAALVVAVLVLIQRSRRKKIENDQTEGHQIENHRTEIKEGK